MRKQISLIGKRLAAGLLGAAMLFTAAGVAAPVEVKAAEVTYRTTNITVTVSQTGNPDAFYDERNMEVGDSLKMTIPNTEQPGYTGGKKANVLSITVNGIEEVSGNPNSIETGQEGVFRFNATTAGNYTVKIHLQHEGMTNNHYLNIKGTISSLSTGTGTGTTPGGSTGSGTTTPGTTTGGTTPGTGTITGSTTGGTGTSTDTKPATRKTEPSIPVHTHSYNWETLHEPTEDHDGEMVDICSVCGDIRQRVPITGFYLFQKETMDKIKAAAPNATVEVKTSKWISFHRMVMNALAERQDVTLKVSFLEGEYRGARKTLTIPAGTDTAALLNEDGYAGFKYLGGLFGLE